YNKYPFARLAQEFPGFDWAAWAKAQDLTNVQDVMVGQPSFFKGYAELAASAPLSAWKACLTAQLLSDPAESLSQPFVDARFAFFDRALRGQQVMRTRQERAVAFVN